MITTIKPTGDRILVQPVERRERDLQHNGIVIPDNAVEPNRLFYVIACGPKVKLVQAGNRVVSRTYDTGMVHLEDGTGRGFLRESECMALLPE